MKKFLYVVGIIFAVIIGLAIILGVIADRHDRELGARQTFAIMNSSSYKGEILFYSNSDKTVDRKNAPYSLVVEPGKTGYINLHKGIYQYHIYNKDTGKYVRKVTGLKVRQKSDEDNYKPIYIDIPGDKYIVLLNVNFLFKGGDMANSLSKSMGTNKTKPYVKKLYMGNKPFYLPEIVHTRDELIVPGGDLPEEITYSKLVYALVPVSGKVKNNKDLLIEAVKYVKEKFL